MFGSGRRLRVSLNNGICARQTCPSLIWLKSLTIDSEKYLKWMPSMFRGQSQYRNWPDRAATLHRSDQSTGTSANQCLRYIVRLPATMSPMRCGGTPIFLAKRHLVKPSGFKNSSRGYYRGACVTSSVIDGQIYGT